MISSALTGQSSCHTLADPARRAPRHQASSASLASTPSLLLRNPGTHALSASRSISGAHLFVDPSRGNAPGPSLTWTPAVPRAEIRTEQKVRVKLGPYKDGAISATVPAPRVSSEEVEKAWQARKGKTQEFERVNFTGTGSALGHTVKINFEGKYAEGPQAGQLLKGTKAAGYELELKERDDEPWRTFVREITVAGMGQEESKTFLVNFPVDYKAKPLAGIKARFTVTVKEIGVKKPLPQDTRPESERRAEVERELKAAAERKSNEELDSVIRSALLSSSEADVEKVAASVTWAKFGEKSLQDFKWNVLMEEVARVEAIPFESVLPFLRAQSKVTYT